MKYLMLMIVIVVTACTPFRSYKGVEIPTNVAETDLTTTQNKHVSFDPNQPVEEWWYQYDDPILGQLVELALEENLDVKIALANVEEARAIARETIFDFFPTVNTTGGATRIRPSGRAGFAAPQGFTSYDAQFDASWELDLFGRIRQGRKEAKALREATQDDLNQIYVTVAAEVGINYMTLRGEQYRLDIAERNAANQRKTYRLAKDLEEAGQATALDTARAEAQLKLTEASIPQRRAVVTNIIRRLSVLTGQAPDTLALDLAEFRPIPSLKSTVSVGTVNELLERRPDVSAAERRLAASIARYNISATELFPRISLNGTLGYSATQLRDLTSSDAIGSTVGPSITWRALDIGRVRAEIAQTDARAEVAYATFTQTMLQALEETQNALSDYSYELDRRKSLQQAARASKRAADLARQRYRQGVDDFLDSLDAERTQLEAEDTLALSEIAAATNLVDIYKSLSGGWRTQEE